MAEALDSTFQDYGPVRFPLPQGHPLFQDEEALEAALLQDALEGVGLKSLMRAMPGMDDSIHQNSSGGWLAGLAGAAGGAASGLADRLSSIVSGGMPHLLPAWGAENESGSVRTDSHRDSEGHEHPSHDPSASHLHGQEYPMSFTEAPKVIGEPASPFVSSEVQQQHPDTCAIQCQRLILNEFGVGVTEDQLVTEASARGIYNHGTSPDDVGKLLESHGLAVNRFDNANVFNLSNELAQGHKVIVGVDSSDLWTSQNGIVHEILDFLGLAKADHAVIVSGIDTTDPDHVKVNITDPGTGDVAKSYPIEQFLDAWKGSDFTMVATAHSAPDTSAGMMNFPYDQGHIPMVGHAPYALVQGLSESIDPHLSPDAMSGVESQFFDAVNGVPLDPGAIVHVGPFPGDVGVQALFDAYGSPGGQGSLDVAFRGWTHEVLFDPSFGGGLYDSPIADPDTFSHLPHTDPLGGGIHHHDPSLDVPFQHGSDSDLFNHDV